MAGRPTWAGSISASPGGQATAYLAKRNILTIEPLRVEPEPHRDVAESRLPLDPAAALLKQRAEKPPLALGPGGKGALPAAEAADMGPIEQPLLYPIGDQAGGYRRRGLRGISH
jgi:hypothetical protein